MTMRLLGFPSSHNVQKVLWACGEIGLDYAWEDWAGPNANAHVPEFVALNPNRRVPVIVEDDSTVLWESHAITRYLCAKHARGTLWPEDDAKRASAERWMDWQLGTVGPTMAPVYNNLIRTVPEDRNQAVIDSGMERLAELFGILDSHLARNAHVAGDDFSMGDIPIGISTWRWFNMPVERPDLTNLARWFEALRDRPAYRDHIMKDLA